MADGDARELISRDTVFDGTCAEVRAFRVPVSERYPEGVKYRMQYGRSDDISTAWEDGTVFRYDNFPDHPDAATHHKHTERGTVEPVEFEGVFALYRRFKQEVIDHGEEW